MFFIFMFYICALFADNNSILTINNINYSYNDFYDFYPKQRWFVADSVKREEVYSNFIKRQLCILEAKKIGLNKGPDFKIKSRSSLRQLLVNETYEQLVAVPLIKDETIESARSFAKTTVFAKHILIGHVGAQLKFQQTRSLDEALVLSIDIWNKFNNGVSFSELAKKYSDDPSVEKNAGVIGWVGWGQTVPAFEQSAFSLSLGELSDPVLTKYGYHLILITDKKPSDLAFLPKNEYENAIINLSKTSVRNKLRVAAINYDSLQLKTANLYFNFTLIDSILSFYNKKNEENLLKGSSARVDVVDILQSMSGVVCVYNNKGFGGKWFANKMKDVPLSQQPFFNSSENIISMFKTIVLQEIATISGRTKGVDNSFNYKKRSSSVVGGLLYNAYLKFIVNNAPPPDSSLIIEYYNKNQLEKYFNKDINEVYSNIEVLLIKENQSLAKKDSINMLFHKYSIIKNNDFLQTLN